jgi:hypothetical protein
LHETAPNRPVWRAVTLRRAGRFDPVQFFGGDLIRINSNAANLAHKFQYWVDDGGQTVVFCPLVASAIVGTACFDERRFVAFAIDVAKMPRYRQNPTRSSYYPDGTSR